MGRIQRLGLYEKTISFRIFENGLNRQHSKDVSSGLIIQVQFPVSPDTLRPQGLFQTCAPHVVGCRSQCPRTELFFRFEQVFARSTGGLLDVVTFINLTIDLQPISRSR